tara:strand:- start:5422 stop:8895 length:3474 start_codon:yes stop_codon:yes gene_type:complete
MDPQVDVDCLLDDVYGHDVDVEDNDEPVFVEAKSSLDGYVIDRAFRGNVLLTYVRTVDGKVVIETETDDAYQQRFLVMKNIDEDNGPDPHLLMDVNEYRLFCNKPENYETNVKIDQWRRDRTVRRIKHHPIPYTHPKFKRYVEHLQQRLSHGYEVGLSYSFYNGGLSAAELYDERGVSTPDAPARPCFLSVTITANTIASLKGRAKHLERVCADIELASFGDKEPVPWEDKYALNQGWGILGMHSFNRLKEIGRDKMGRLTYECTLENIAKYESKAEDMADGDETEDAAIEVEIEPLYLYYDLEAIFQYVVVTDPTNTEDSIVMASIMCDGLKVMVTMDHEIAEERRVDEPTDSRFDELDTHMGSDGVLYVKTGYHQHDFLDDFAMVVKIFDPDFVFAWNGIGYDNIMLCRMYDACMHGSLLPDPMSTTGDYLKQFGIVRSNRMKGLYDMHLAHSVEGMHWCDLMILYSNIYKIEQQKGYSLSRVAKSCGIADKHSVSYTEISEAVVALRYWHRYETTEDYCETNALTLSPNGRKPSVKYPNRRLQFIIDKEKAKSIMRRTYDYCMHDTEIMLEIVSKKNIIEQGFVICDIVGLNALEAFRRGVTWLVKALVGPLYQKQNIIQTESPIVKSAYVGGMVLDPIRTTVSVKQVICYDYTALYPSCIINNNIGGFSILPVFLRDMYIEKFGDEHLNKIECRNKSRKSIKLTEASMRNTLPLNPSNLGMLHIAGNRNGVDRSTYISFNPIRVAGCGVTMNKTVTVSAEEALAYSSIPSSEGDDIYKTAYVPQEGEPEHLWGFDPSKIPDRGEHIEYAFRGFDDGWALYKRNEEGVFELYTYDRYMVLQSVSMEYFNVDYIYTHPMFIDPLADACKRLLSERQVYKDVMKRVKKDLKNETDPTRVESLKKEHKKADDKQQGYKIMVNSIYGALGLTAPNQAVAVTMSGQERLRHLSKSLHTHRAINVYGDTDSCYITTLFNVQEEQFAEFAERFGDFINETYMGDFEATLDFVAKSASFIKKKCYMILLEDETIVYKGVSAKRGDRLEMAKNAQKAVADIILHENDEYVLKARVDEVKASIEQRLNSGDFSIQEVCKTQKIKTKTKGRVLEVARSIGADVGDLVSFYQDTNGNYVAIQNGDVNNVSKEWVLSQVNGSISAVY